MENCVTLDTLDYSDGNSNCLVCSCFLFLGCVAYFSGFFFVTINNKRCVKLEIICFRLYLIICFVNHVCLLYIMILDCDMILF